MKPARTKRLILFAAVVVFVIVLIGCAPDTGATSSGTGSGAGTAEVVDANAPSAESFTWDAGADCASCHATEGASLANSKAPVSLHTAQGLDCSACHADTSGLTTAHKGATSTSKMPKRLIATRIAEQTCLSSGCHVSRESLAQLTEKSKTLTDSAGTVVNPHDLPAGGDHSDLSCGNCHALHEETPAATLAKETCISCHHQDVFECNTCHEG